MGELNYASENREFEVTDMDELNRDKNAEESEDTDITSDEESDDDDLVEEVTEEE